MSAKLKKSINLRVINTAIMILPVDHIRNFEYIIKYMYNKVFKLQEELIKSIAHSRRLEIINLLRETELSVGDIYKMLNLPQANVSQHLQILRDNDIVETKKIGQKVFYSLKNAKIIKAYDLIREVLVEKLENDPLADEFDIKMKSLVPLTQDPVCKMRVSPKTAGFAHSHKNNDYYFCASGCLRVFKKDPNKYVR